MRTIPEPARNIPVIATYDVLVCGAGPAGVSAALAASRAGARTGLIETYGCLGGIWTTGALAYFLDYANKSGIMAEIIVRLEEQEARGRNSERKGTNTFDVESVKVLLDDMCLAEGVDIRLHTRACGTHVVDGRIQHVITESKSGRQALAAKVVIDCTGDGDVAALAGCGFELGHPDTGVMQPMSLICLLTGISRSEARPFYREGTEPWSEAKERLKEAMEAGGFSPSYTRPSLFPVRDNLYILMANHQYGVDGTCAEDVTRATLEGRRELNNLIDGLRSTGGVWQNIRLVATAGQIGVREGRRIHGKYTVRLDDMLEGREHDDAVCKVTFGIDIHATDPIKGKAIESHEHRIRPYDIPLRALIARDVEGMMMAGRCISGDFLAHSSYRVTGNASAIGEAAGRYAARGEI